MYEIRNYSNDFKEDALSFLKEVPAISEVDEKVLENASFLLEDNKIGGMISYEEFDRYALIRYFVFKNTIEKSLISDLICHLSTEVKNKSIDYLFSIINNDYLVSMFETLGFENMEKSKVFLDEEVFSNPKYQGTSIMIKKI